MAAYGYKEEHIDRDRASWSFVEERIKKIEKHIMYSIRNDFYKHSRWGAQHSALSEIQKLKEEIKNVQKGI